MYVCEDEAPKKQSLLLLLYLKRIYMDVYKWCIGDQKFRDQDHENESSICIACGLELETKGYYLETDPDPVAMVIRIELFTHKLSDTNTYWHYVTGVFYLQGLWMNSSTLITMATGSGSVSR